MLRIHIYLQEDEYDQLLRLANTESLSRTIGRLITQQPTPRPAEPPEGRFHASDGRVYVVRHEPIHSGRPERTMVEPELVGDGPHDGDASHLGIHRHDSNQRRQLS